MFAGKEGRGFCQELGLHPQLAVLRSNSRNRARSDTVNGYSTTGCARRYTATQFADVPSCTPNCRAVAAIDSLDPIASWTASCRNSDEYFRRVSPIPISLPLTQHSIGSPVRETQGTSVPLRWGG